MARIELEPRTEWSGAAKGSVAGDGERIGVLLLNMGGPASLAAVKPFLLELFRDRDLISFPGGPRLQGCWAWMIATLRASAVRKRYERIGGRSPILEWSQLQASNLERQLNARGRAEGEGGRRYTVKIAMRYAPPRADDALGALAAENCHKVVVVPLYPQECLATTGSSLLDLERALRREASQRAGRNPAPCIVRSYHDHPLYVRALAARVHEGLERIPEPRRAQAVVIFSAHGVPARLVESGDPYVVQTEETVERLVTELGSSIGRYRVSWQSRVGPIRWVRPTTTEVVRELGRKGQRTVLVVPVSFVSDHIETLHEIDIELAGEAERSGIDCFVRAPALNESELFIDALTDIVRRNV